MNSATDESESQRTGHKRVRFALIACFVVFCLAVFYVLLSAPLLLYSAKHPGGSTAQLVDIYMQPLLWGDDLPPTGEPEFAEYEEPLRTRVLYKYYRLWGSEVEMEYTNLRMNRFFDALMESLDEETPFLGADGPGSGIPDSP